MQAIRNNKSFAKKLLELSLDENGCVSLEKVETVLSVLRSKPPHKLKPLLKQYQFYLLQQNQKKEAFFESAGEVNEKEIQSIKKSLEQYYQAELKLIQHQDPSLLAGFCISVGDDVWEASVAKNLRKLLSNTH